MVPADGKDTIELPSNNASPEKDLIASRLQSDAASDNKSDGCKRANMVTCDTMDGVSAPSGDVTCMDAVIGHKDVKMSPLSGISSSPLDKEKEIADKISVEASLSDLKISSQVIAGLDPVTESEEDASSGAARKMLCEPAEQCPLMEDASKIEGTQSQIINKVSMQCTKDMEVCPVLCDSTANKGNDAEVLEKENDEKGSSKVLEPTVNNNEILGPISLEGEECQVDTSLKGQKDNESAIMCGDISDGKIAVLSTNDCGSCADVGKPTSVSPIAIGAAGEFQSESDKDGAKCSVVPTSVADSNASKALSCSRDPKKNDASKDERSFTFEVSPLANVPQKEAGNEWQPFFNIPATKVSPIVDASPSASGLVQIDPKIAQDPSHGSPKGCDVAVRTGSKGTSERKTRRSSGKALGKESARKGNPTKETASVRLEKGEKMSNVSPGPTGISQHVQLNEMQCYGHVDSSTMKPFVLASSTSNLPDLNSSVSPSLMFHQPFTDMQQVQLRAQIFVYGALIQGTAPDEAYMISAFGGSDGGKSIWENALRLSIERLHGQKPHLTALETLLLSHPGARAPDQAIKQSNVQSKVISSPIGRISKGTPTIVNPMVPLSSPLWSIPNPSSDTFQSSSMPRGPVMDHQRTLSPLHLHQTPQIRNFAGNPWMSQSPFCGPWGTSPQTLALDTIGRFSAQLPITEPVQLTPVKDLSKPIASGPKHVSPGPVAQSGASDSVFTGNFPVADAKKVTTSSSQPLTDPKPRKRKKASVSESPGQNISHTHLQTESVPGPVVTSYPLTSFAMTTPIVFASKPPTERFVTSVSPMPTDMRKGDQNAEQRNILSEETLDKVKAARVQAEDAANLAAAAVSQRQEIWNQLDKQRNSGLSPDVETKLASAAVAIAAAAAVAKAAAAAANVASNAALQAKLMADEALVSGGYNNPSQDSAISVSEGMESLGKATPDSILKGDDGTNSSSSILVAARETARWRVEVASSAAIRAENMDAIVKAAELAAEAVSQAGKIVAMGDPLSLNELVAAGPEGYWEVAQINNELSSKSNDIRRKTININIVGEGSNTSPVPGTERDTVQ
ncbi:hypothetical protein OIU77_027552 [Salix suchowensis]|uniref:Uncharacterized protein n=1 Tax=Salix suchowensis TaxID=1278906 RepID=A0ABQ9BSV6_9ROSI|nr:hypothetical protein OIU77_027552 [Salix suchowensis]